MAKGKAPGTIVAEKLVTVYRYITGPNKGRFAFELASDVRREFPELLEPPSDVSPRDYLDILLEANQGLANEILGARIAEYEHHQWEEEQQAEPEGKPNRASKRKR
jgi:hypothetical protein